VRRVAAALGCPNRRWPRTFLLSSEAFMVSLGRFFVLIDRGAGVRIRTGLPEEIPLRALGMSALLLAALDVWRILAGRFGSTGLIRQTPRTAAASSVSAVVVWGLDMGLPVTTDRAIALPFRGIAGVAVGFGSRGSDCYMLAGSSVPSACSRPGRPGSEGSPMTAPPWPSGSSASATDAEQSASGSARPMPYGPWQSDPTQPSATGREENRQCARG